MATSWVTETKEKENYTKLCRLLYDGGTLAVRTAFDGICPPTSLATSLNFNIPILQRLRRPAGNILSQNQWDLLYPPSGASPKSEDFDITLLFVLLRNICSLTPPPTGWNDLPSSTDKSLEANLVRIKYYRNNVTAHGSKAEVDDTLFETYWSDISDALVLLGLKQDDIDELKSSRLGTKDYNHLVEYWDLSDAEIKHHLEASNTATAELKTDTAAIKTDTSMIKTDTSEIKTDIAHLKSKFSNMEKTCTQAVKSEIAKLAHIDLTIMKDTSKIKTDTSKIKTDTEIKTDTSEIKTYTSEIKKKTSKTKKKTSKIKKKPSKIKKKPSKIKTDIAHLKSKLSSMEKTCAQVESEIAKLAHIDFSTFIQKSCELYHQSTRQWIFNQVEKTVQKATSRASVVLIRAGAGMGKSIVAAKICDIYKKRGFLGGCHFFQHSNSERNNPRMMLQSIARQLCDSLTGYQAALEAKLKTTQGRKISDLNCEELFGVLFEEPLSQICVDHNVVIVIDALDECASKFKEEIEEVLKRKLSDLPSWIQFVITTRPLPSCCNLSPVVQLEIDPSDSRNVQDLREFFTFQLAQRNANHLIEQLMEIPKGLFLVAYFVLKILDENGHESVADVLKRFPLGISSVYEYYVKRIHELVKPYIHQSENEGESFFKMLKAMVAAKSPIPKKMFYEILCLKNLEEVQRAKRKERNDAVHLLHTIFPVENDHVSVFHKSVTDWLNLDGENIHQFSVTASNGCEVLSNKNLDVLKAFKKAVEKGETPFDQPLVLSDSETFALRFGLEYVNNSSKLNQTEKDEIIKDFIIMAAILSSFNDNLSDIFDLLNSLDGRFSYFFYIMAECVCNCNFTSVFLNGRQFEEIDFDNKKVSFGQFLSIVGDVILTEDILPTDQKQKLLSLCIKYKLPYYSFYPVASSLPSAFQHQSSSSFFDLFDITNGFIAVNVDPDAEPQFSTVLKIKDDGSFGEHKTFSSVHVRGVSPDKKFLIITKTDSSKVELFDVTTLEKVREYNCPIKCVDSCHIFGDEQWYIVVKAQGDPNIHILDGLNGQLHDTIEVGEDEKIEGVSQCGHIVISHNIVKSTTVEDDDDEEDDDEEDKDGDDDDEEDDDDFNGDDTLKDEILFLKTIHFSNRDVKIYYSPPEVDNLHDGGWKKDLLNENFKFSDDGKYFSLYSDKKVHIFHTNDGTLYRIVKYNYTMFSKTEIVFLSFSCLVVRFCGFPFFRSLLTFYDLLNSKVIYSARTALTDESRMLVPSQHHTDKSIPRTVFALNRDGLVKYKFHNLE